MARSSGKQVGDDSGDALLLGDELHDHEVAVEEEPADKAGSDRALLIVFGVMVAVGLCNNILRVLQFGPMHNVSRRPAGMALRSLRRHGFSRQPPLVEDRCCCARPAVTYFRSTRSSPTS